MKSRIWKKIAVSGVLLGAIASLSIVGSNPLTANASTNSLITTTALNSLSASINAQAFPTGSLNAVVTVESPAYLVQQASALAAGLNVPLVIAGSTAPSSTTVANLHSLGVTHIRMVGRAGSFTTAYTNALSASFTIDSNVAITGNFLRSQAVAQPLGVRHIVVAEAAQPTDVRIAANYAAQNGFPLILLDGTETSAALSTFFANYSGSPISLVGAAESVASSITGDQTQQIDVLPTTDPLRTELELSYRAVAQGNVGSDLYTAPNDQLGSLALTALLAHSKRGISLPAGATTSLNQSSPVTNYATLWASEISSIHLTGTGLAAVDLATISSPTTGIRQTPPAWRTTGTTLGTGNWTLAYTAFPGSVRYDVFDVFGTQTGSSTTTQVTVTGTPTAETIVAYNSSNTEIGRLEYRANQYKTASDQESAVIGSTRNGSNYLKFLGSLRVPRVVTRTVTDGLVDPPISTSSVVAITCLGYFVDTNLDPTKEYSYDVQTQGGANNRACDPTASLDPTTFTSIQSSAVTLPLTEFPAITAISNSTKSSASSLKIAQKTLAATPTVSDAQLLRAMGKPTAKSKIFDAAEIAASPSSATTQASSLPNYAVRYQGFIADQYVPFPGFTGDLAYPVVAFGGDNRGGGISYGSFRFRATVLFYFQNSPQTVTMTPEIGISHQYKCNVFLNACVLTATAQQSTNTIKMPFSSISGDLAVAEINLNSTLPLVSVAPPINGDLVFVIRPGNSVIIGTHDAMPYHEIFAGVLPGDYRTSYVSKYALLPCLYGVPAQVCVFHLNRAL